MHLFYEWNTAPDNVSFNSWNNVIGQYVLWTEWMICSVNEWTREYLTIYRLTHKIMFWRSILSELNNAAQYFAWIKWMIVYFMNDTPHSTAIISWNNV